MTLLLITTLLFSGQSALDVCVCVCVCVYVYICVLIDRPRFVCVCVLIPPLRSVQFLLLSSPLLSSGLSSLYRENEAEFRKWDSDQTQGTNKNCTVMKGNGKWYSRQCDKTKPFGGV